jgi:hypothetical protein
LSLNFARIDRERPRSYDTFFGLAVPEEQLRPQPIPRADCEYFRPMIDPSFTPAPLVSIGGLPHNHGALPALSTT